MVGRRRIDDEIGVAHRIAMVGRGAQARAERKPSEESTILVCVVDRARDVGLERPQYRGEAVAGEQIGESGSPRTGADDPATHQANLAAIRRQRAPGPDWFVGGRGGELLPPPWPLPFLRART